MFRLFLPSMLSAVAALWYSDNRNSAIVGNVGEMLPTIVMFNEAGVAHCPADGVNVYAVVPRADVLMLAGLHVPVIPSFDVVGSAGAVAFWQTEFGTVGKVGEMLLTIVIFRETGGAQLTCSGVNV